MDYVNRLDNVAVVKRRADTELGRDLLVVLALVLVGVSGTELLDSKRLAVCSSLHQTHGTTSARSKDSAEFPILALQAVVICKRHALTVAACWGSGAVLGWRLRTPVFALVSHLEKAFKVDFGAGLVPVLQCTIFRTIVLLAEKAMPLGFGLFETACSAARSGRCAGERYK